MTDPASPPPSTRRVGTGMLVLAWIVGLGLAAYWFAGIEQGQRNPNQTPDSQRMENAIEVRLQGNRGGHYLTGGYINGEPVTLLLDTGATMVAVPAGLASELGLRRGPAFMVTTANGMAESFRTRIDRLQIGDIELRDVDAAIVPGMGSDDVLLGMSALRQLDFSQRGGELLLRQTFTEAYQ